jgi:hypothetical protein
LFAPLTAHADEPAQSHIEQKIRSQLDMFFEFFNDPAVTSTGRIKDDIGILINKADNLDESRRNEAAKCGDNNSSPSGISIAGELKNFFIAIDTAADSQCKPKEATFFTRYDRIKSGLDNTLQFSSAPFSCAPCEIDFDKCKAVTEDQEARIEQIQNATAYIGANKNEAKAIACHVDEEHCITVDNNLFFNGARKIAELITSTQQSIRNATIKCKGNPGQGGTTSCFAETGGFSNLYDCNFTNVQAVAGNPGYPRKICVKQCESIDIEQRQVFFIQEPDIWEDKDNFSRICMFDKNGKLREGLSAVKRDVCARQLCEVSATARTASIPPLDGELLDVPAKGTWQCKAWQNSKQYLSRANCPDYDTVIAKECA